MSHERDLPRYAEAAPETFLSLLEADLKTAGAGCSRSAQTCEHRSLRQLPPDRPALGARMSRMETAKPPRVVSILAQLSQTKINDNWANKPIGSLEAIFRSWMPQTAASLEERCKALELLTRRYPDIGWEICVEQFNPGSRVGDYSYRPHWRSDASGAGQPVETRKEIYEFARKALDLALAWPSHDENTLGDLVERLGGMAEEDHATLWRLIEDWAADPNTTDKARATLRERIRRFALTRVGRRRVEDEATRDRARAIYAKLEPSDPVIRHGWLFEKQWVEESADELEEDDLDFNAREERIHALRLDRARRHMGPARLRRRRRTARGERRAPTVGQYAALCITDSTGRIDFLLRCLALRGELEQKADACMLGFLWSVDAAPRQALLLAVADKLDADQRVTPLQVIALREAHLADRRRVRH